MKNMIVVIAVFVFFFILAISNISSPSGRYYNCRDIEILPDVPPKVREECRRIIKERLEEQRRQSDQKNISA